VESDEHDAKQEDTIMKLPLHLFQIALTVLATGVTNTAAAVAVAPLPLPGPYAVECTDVAQDTTKLAAGEDIQLYWEGVPRSDGSVRKPTDLLQEPANTPAVTVQAPSDSNVFGSFAGRALPYVVIICHPTTADNPRGDYALPTGKIVPHMMRTGDAPLWPDATTRFGYVVAAPFHTDATFSDLKLENVSDVIYLLTHLQNFLAMQALRPLALSASIDLLQADPQWRDRIDSAQIGGFGASMGGESMMLMAGAGLTTSVGLSWTQIERDTRLKAAVGYVPYFGQPILPSFGRDQHGLDGVNLPFLGIGGTADTTAPIEVTAQGMLRLGAPRELVALSGVKHEFNVPATNDIFTWSVIWLDAMVRGNESAKSQLSNMTSVAGGNDDFVAMPLNALPASNYTGLWWAAAGAERGWGIAFEQQGCRCSRIAARRRATSTPGPS
jgi:predicted dienelactone hydrolase